MLLNQGGFTDLLTLQCHLVIFNIFCSNSAITVYKLNLLTQTTYLVLLHIWWYYTRGKDGEQGIKIA